MENKTMIKTKMQTKMSENKMKKTKNKTNKQSERTKQTKRAKEQMSEESGQLIKEQKTAGHKEKTNYKIEIKQTKKKDWGIQE